MNIKNLTISRNDKITFVSNFYTMLSSGIPILETVDSLLEDAKGGIKKLLLTLKEDLTQGQHVASTFAKFPKVFDKVTVNIIKASEEAGTLDTSLKDLKDTIKKENEFNDKIKSALIYPTFIIIVFIAVFVMILVVVIPKISTVFSRLNVPLPLPTKIMIFMSNSLLSYPIPIAAGAAVIIGTIIYLYKQNKSFFVRCITSLPVVSKLAAQIDLTRVTRNLNLLLSAGIPITIALELTEDVVVKKDLKEVIAHVKEVVIGGKNLSQGLKDRKKSVPQIMIKIIEAGERSGELDKSMQDVADYLDYEVSNSLKTLTALIEPLLLVFVGIAVGGMMLAIIGPIYGMIGQIGPR